MTHGHLLLVATGGTISMLRDARTGCSVSRRTAADLLALVSARIGPEVRALDFSLPHRSYVHPDDLLAFVRFLQGEMVAELRGVVVAHGTDTLEEVAYLVDEILGTRVPLVVTGAMRPGWAAGFDGARNLDNAFRLVQAAPAEYGVLVTMNDDIFEAWSLCKADTGGLDAFVARRGAACGRIVGDVVEFAWRPLIHALEELGEVARLVLHLEGYKGGEDPEAIKEELATELSDLLVFLFKLAYQCGIDVEEALKAGQVKADQRWGDLAAASVELERYLTQQAENLNRLRKVGNQDM